MSVTRGFGVYRVIKASMDFVNNGSLDKLLWYSLLDIDSIRIFHGRLLKGDKSDLPQGVKASWRDFCSFVDDDLILVPPQESAPEVQTEADGQASVDEDKAPVEDESASTPVEILFLKELRGALENCGIYDIKEENLAKLRCLEESFATIGGSFYGDGCFAFIRVENLSTMEAEELLDLFPEESAKEDLWSNVKAEDNEKKESKSAPKAVFPCFAVVAPIGGIPALELFPGDTVSLAVPSDSLLYSIVKYQRGGDFSGEMNVTLSSVKQGGGERLLLEFILSDELSAVAVVQSNLRVRAVKGVRSKPSNRVEISPAMQQGLVVTAVGLAVLILILIFFVR